MNDLKVVIGFTIKDMVRRKSFIISTIIILLFIILGFNIPNIMNAISGEENSNSKEKILVVDTNNIYEGTLDELNSLDLGYEFEVVTDNIEFNEIKQKIENGEIESSIIIEKNDSNLKIRYIVESMTSYTQIPEDLSNALNSAYSSLQISKLGLTQEQLNSLNPNIEFTMEQTEEEEVKGNVIIIMLLSLVLFYAIYFCAYQVSSSITTEKTSRIIETLVTSTSPTNIVVGKTIGIGLVGLAQLCIIVLTALICAKSFIEPEILNSVLDMSMITPSLGIITIAYFILGYFTYAMLYALTGSTVSKPEDIQSANTPVAFVAIIGFYLSYFTMMNPTSSLNVFASIFPISSPFCMPFRVMMGIAEPSEIIISFIVLILTIIVITKLTIKIYSNAILNYGGKIKIREFLHK